MSSGPTVETVLLCDDARREDNGKHILIGVYAGTVLLTEVPAILPTFAVYCEVRHHQTRDDKVSMEIEGPNGELVAKIIGEIEFPTDADIGAFFYKVSPIKLPAEGEYKIKMAFGDAITEPVKTFVLLKREIPKVRT